MLYNSLALVGSVIPLVLFLVIAWRAMRARERIADAAVEWMRKQSVVHAPIATSPQPRVVSGPPPAGPALGTSSTAN